MCWRAGFLVVANSKRKIVWNISFVGRTVELVSFSWWRKTRGRGRGPLVVLVVAHDRRRSRHPAIDVRGPVRPPCEYHAYVVWRSRSAPAHKYHGARITNVYDWGALRGNPNAVAINWTRELETGSYADRFLR